MLPEVLVLLPLLLGAAAVEDSCCRRIPNAISLGGAVLGLVLWAQHDGIAGFETGLMGWTVRSVRLTVARVAGFASMGSVPPAT